MPGGIVPGGIIPGCIIPGGILPGYIMLPGGMDLKLPGGVPPLKLPGGMPPLKLPGGVPIGGKEDMGPIALIGGGIGGVGTPPKAYPPLLLAKGLDAPVGGIDPGKDDIGPIGPIGGIGGVAEPPPKDCIEPDQGAEGPNPGGAPGGMTSAIAARSRPRGFLTC